MLTSSPISTSSPGARGFSLIEVLIVVALAAILTGLGAPGFRALRRNAAVAATADQLLGALYFAQSTAARRNTPTSLCLAGGSQRCATTAGAVANGWLVFFDVVRGSPVQFSPGDEKLSDVHLASGVEITGTRSAVTFWPTARAGTTATFTICDSHDPTYRRTVVVSQTGRPRVTPQASGRCGV